MNCWLYNSVINSRTNFTEKNKVHHGISTSKLIFSQFFKGICICSNQFSETFPTQKDKYIPFLFSQNEKDPKTLWSWATIYSFWLFPFSFIEFLFFLPFQCQSKIHDQLYIQNTYIHTHTHTHTHAHTPSLTLPFPS